MEATRGGTLGTGFFLSAPKLILQITEYLGKSCNGIDLSARNCLEILTLIQVSGHSLVLHVALSQDRFCNEKVLALSIS